MIQALGLTKKYGAVHAADGISLEIPDGAVCGLIGTNGAGKSTFLRLAAGILKPDAGTVTIDGADPYESPGVKERFFYVSDDQYFFPNTLPDRAADFCALMYPGFDRKRFGLLMKDFSLPSGRRVGTYSKGMRKLLSMILALSAGTDYILLDETFDGLDPGMRRAAGGLIKDDVVRRGLTAVISSHSTRELEDICGQAVIMHNGRVIFSGVPGSADTGIHKLQFVPGAGMSAADLDLPGMLSLESRGSVLVLTARGSYSDIEAAVRRLSPVFCEELPLSLEEIFMVLGSKVFDPNRYPALLRTPCSRNASKHS